MGISLKTLASDPLSTEMIDKMNQEEHEKIQTLLCDSVEELLEHLDEKGKTSFEDYSAIRAREAYLYATEQFIAGYRFGVLLTNETLMAIQDKSQRDILSTIKM